MIGHMADPPVLWSPPLDALTATRVGRYLEWLQRVRGHDFKTYDQLYDWSVSDLDGFWGSVWEHLGVVSSTPFTAVLAERTMPGARWFPDARLNWAEHALRL